MGKCEVCLEVSVEEPDVRCCRCSEELKKTSCELFGNLMDKTSEDDLDMLEWSFVAYKLQDDISEMERENEIIARILRKIKILEGNNELLKRHIDGEKFTEH
jgi:hypothetical protein